MLPQRPLGVASVDNPAATFGGTAPETLDEARSNAPRTVLTIDRVVSLGDYEEYARGFGGIAQAQAVSLPGGAGPTVFITVAGPNGTEVPRQPTLNDLLVRRVWLVAKRPESSTAGIDRERPAH